MTTPTDLVAHYSNKAFQTRITALVAVGATLGADIAWTRSDASGTLGLAVIVVVGSLAEMNRRYTHSYACACHAASRNSKAGLMWSEFTAMNEHPYVPSLRRRRQRRSHSAEARRSPVFGRFMLSWGTYLPGVFAGLYLTGRGAFGSHPSGSVAWQHELEFGLAVVFSAALLSWWGLQSASVRDPTVVLADSKPDQAGRRAPADQLLDSRKPASRD